MQITIIYATTEGQTRRIARHIQQRIARRKCHGGAARGLRIGQHARQGLALDNHL